MFINFDYYIILSGPFLIANKKCYHEIDDGWSLFTHTSHTHTHTSHTHTEKHTTRFSRVTPRTTTPKTDWSHWWPIGIIFTKRIVPKILLPYIYQILRLVKKTNPTHTGSEWAIGTDHYINARRCTCIVMYVINSIFLTFI